MKIDDDKKLIKAIYFNGPNGEKITATDNQRLQLDAQYHGDRDEFWVEQYIDDILVASHNCRFIESIEWV